MWAEPFLFFVSESTSLWILVEGVSMVWPEGHIMISGMEDGMVTPGAYEKPYESGALIALVRTITESMTFT